MQDEEEQRLKLAAVANAREILAARQRAEEQLLRAKEALEARTRELDTSVALLRATLEATADGILATDDAGVITEFNARYVEMWNLGPVHARPRNHHDILPIVASRFADPAAFLARVKAIYASAERQTFDVLELADGRVFERFSRKQTVDGREVGRVWSFRDITERVHAQQALRDQAATLERAQRALRQMNESLETAVIERTAALRRSEVQFQQLVNGVADCAIYMLDRTGRVVSWNPGAERIKGYTAAEVIGRNFSLFYTEQDRAAGKAAQSLAIAEREGKYEAEAWRIRKDGTRFWASVLIDPIRDDGAADRIRESYTRHERAACDAGATASVAEDGGHRAAHRWRRSRLQ